MYIEPFFYMFIFVALLLFFAIWTNYQAFL